MGKHMGQKSQGNIMDLVTIGITILFMSIVVMVYLECTELIMKKLEVSQVARKYILKMETEGYLSQVNKTTMLEELKDIGVKKIDITGTTIQPVAYGDTILLKIKGTVTAKRIGEEEIWNGLSVSGQIPLEETRMSTAKN